MKIFRAPYIFTGKGQPVKNGILRCSDDGVVIDVLPENSVEHSNAEIQDGFIVPGFVNAHCHLELSNMKGLIDEKQGIGHFIGEINKKRNFSPETLLSTIEEADNQMWNNGISAIGDISNSSVTIPVKQKSKIYYHTFIESFGFLPERADRAFSIALAVYNEFIESNLSSGITPHAPYSVSPELFLKIRDFVAEKKSVVSLHNQESEGENRFFESGDGLIASHLKNNLSLDLSHWKPTGKSSVKSVLHFIPGENRLLLVHNTFTDASDIDFIVMERNPENTFFVVCPNSNLYIENKLPPLRMFLEKKVNICIGTDSYASNGYLSVFEELKTIQRHFPETRFTQMVEWGCYNGARALGVDAVFGSFEPGKKPGVLLITDVDKVNLKITDKSNVIRMI